MVINLRAAVRSASNDCFDLLYVYRREREGAREQAYAMQLRSATLSELGCIREGQGYFLACSVRTCSAISQMCKFWYTVCVCFISQWCSAACVCFCCTPSINALTQ
jgi:hypothetical protein